MQTTFYDALMFYAIHAPFPHHQAAMAKFDICMASVLVIGCVYYSIYMCGYAMSFSAKSNYKAYDGESIAPANWFLPVRQAPSTTVTSEAYLSSSLLSSLKINLPDSSDMPGR